MSYLFDYGEGLFCFVPVFTIVGLVFLALVWNSLPKRFGLKKEKDDEHSDN